MKRVLLSTALAMTLSAHFGFAQLCPPDDAFEPNDTLLDASLLAGPVTLGPLVVLFDDPDLFRLTVQPGMEAIFDLVYSSSIGPLALRLTLSDGTLLDFDNAYGSNQQVSAANFSMSPLDLVIGVDTAVMHLAAAMGKPAWLLIPFMPDYRWLLDRDDTPWYGSMRLFRQAKRGDWAQVVDRVAAELTSWQQSLG